MADSSDNKRSLQEIWQLGCAGEPLSDAEGKHFDGLARSRFYTFRLGMAHARDTTDPARAESVVAGFATELIANPGLEQAWRTCEFGRDHDAHAVREEIELRRFGPGERPLH